MPPAPELTRRGGRAGGPAGAYTDILNATRPSHAREPHRQVHNSCVPCRVVPADSKLVLVRLMKSVGQFDATGSGIYRKSSIQSAAGVLNSVSFASA